MPLKHADSRYGYRVKTLKGMGFNSYDEYLASALWKDIRQRVLDRDGNQCRACGADAYTAHHIDYTRQALSGKDLSRLIAICRSCHYSVEFDRKQKLTRSQDIADRLVQRTKRNKPGSGKRSKAFRLKCRCCGLPRRCLGRNDICLTCHKKHRKKVHEVAEERSC